MAATFTTTLLVKVLVFTSDIRFSFGLLRELPQISLVT
jgi:hypothetical protein